MFEYVREKIANNGIFFLQETHSSHNTVINWRDDFKGEWLASSFNIWVAKKLKLIE